MEKNLEAFEKIKNGNLKEHLKWDEYIACCDLVQGDLEILNLVKKAIFQKNVIYDIKK